MAEANSDKSDKDMTPDERIAWLRERGVLVETAEERHCKQVVNAMKLADQLDSTTEISYVLVPADTSKPLQELHFQSNPEIAGDQLLEHLKPSFASQDATVDTELLRQQQPHQTLLASVDGASTTSVSDAALRQVAVQANIETFSLVHPIPSNNFTGIQIYLDEVGMLKRLPLNKRASDFAARAGFHPPPQFYGDVYLGRIQHKPKLQNRSFVLGPDTAPDAPWLQAATTQNVEYQLEMNHITGRSTDTRQPAVSGSDGVAVTEQGYSWTQTEDELEMVVPLSANVSSKDVSVKFRPQSLEVGVAKTETVVSLPLFERVDVDACTWTLESGGDGADGGGTNGVHPKRLVITMEKCEHAFWPRIRD